MASKKSHKSNHTEQSSHKKDMKKQCCTQKTILWAAAAVVVIIVIILALVFLKPEPQRVVQGDTVSVWYVGKFTTGEVFDTNDALIAAELGVGSTAGTPLAFKVGAGQMIPGFDQGVVGMKLGETKTIQIPPSEAYGNYQADLVISYTDEEFQEVFGLTNVTKGSEYGFALEDGRRGIFVIKDLGTNFVTIDFNHRMAGKTLVFDITLNSIG